MTKKPAKKSSRLESPTKKSTSFILTSRDNINRKSLQQINLLNTSNNNKNKRFRRTLSFINTNRKRATQFCTLKNAKRRRFSLGHIKKIQPQQQDLKFKDYKPSDTIKRLKTMKQRMQQQLTLNSLQQLKNQTIYLNVDQKLKEYIQNQATSNQINYQVS